MSITQLIFLGVDLRVFPFHAVCSVVKRPAVILLLLKSCFGITIATWKVLLYSDIRLDIVVRSSEDIFKILSKFIVWLWLSIHFHQRKSRKALHLTKQDSNDGILMKLNRSGLMKSTCSI